jgi:hypothetical protein
MDSKTIHVLKAWHLPGDNPLHFRDDDNDTSRRALGQLNGQRRRTLPDPIKHPGRLADHHVMCSD